jgi:hypothetical protein
MMDLLPEALRKQLPPLYATEQEEDHIVMCKFFYPCHRWSWYAIEFDGQDIFFGWVDGPCPELGYFSLSEMVNTRDKLGCPIERDVYFQPCRLSKLKADLARSQ